MYTNFKEADYTLFMDAAPYMNKAVGNVIRQLRKKHDYSQEELAGFAKTSRSQIAQLESGARGVTLNSLYWIAEAFGLTFQELLNMVLKEKKNLEG